MQEHWKELMAWATADERYMLELLLHFHEGMKIFKGGSIDTNPLSRAGRFKSWIVSPAQSGELDPGEAGQQRRWVFDLTQSGELDPEEAYVTSRGRSTGCFMRSTSSEEPTQAEPKVGGSAGMP